ncbi:MAG: lyase family protein, partial [Pseudomonadota bacterium]
MSRFETDSIGQRALPDDALYGVNTLRGSENFDISPIKFGDEPAFVRAMVAIKKAAAQANTQIGALDADKGAAIVAACDEILSGAHQDQFIVNMLEGSGGTSINMNVNEVIANRALQIMGQQPGSYAVLSPNDHVNAGQSTNDVVPSAVKLAVHAKCSAMVASLTHLADCLEGKAKEFHRVLKIGRTCMQAAQPMTLGQEFGGYASAVRRAAGKIDASVQDLLALPLGGTAIGTGFGARPGYLDAVYQHLADNLALPVHPAGDMFDGMQNSDGFARVSSEFRIAAEVIGKICLDLIIMSS